MDRLNLISLSLKINGILGHHYLARFVDRAGSSHSSMVIVRKHMRSLLMCCVFSTFAQCASEERQGTFQIEGIARLSLLHNDGLDGSAQMLEIMSNPSALQGSLVSNTGGDHSGRQNKRNDIGPSARSQSQNTNKKGKQSQSCMGECSDNCMQGCLDGAGAGYLPIFPLTQEDLESLTDMNGKKLSSKDISILNKCTQDCSAVCADQCPNQAWGVAGNAGKASAVAWDYKPKSGSGIDDDSDEDSDDSDDDADTSDDSDEDEDTADGSDDMDESGDMSKSTSDDDEDDDDDDDSLDDEDDEDSTDDDIDDDDGGDTSGDDQVLAAGAHRRRPRCHRSRRRLFRLSHRKTGPQRTARRKGRARPAERRANVRTLCEAHTRCGRSPYACEQAVT